MCNRPAASHNNEITVQIVVYQSCSIRAVQDQHMRTRTLSYLTLAMEREIATLKEAASKLELENGSSEQDW
jgi:hypothetical protein